MPSLKYCLLCVHISSRLNRFFKKFGIFTWNGNYNHSSRQLTGDPRAIILLHGTGNHTQEPCSYSIGASVHVLHFVDEPTYRMCWHSMKNKSTWSVCTIIVSPPLSYHRSLSLWLLKLLSNWSDAFLNAGPNTEQQIIWLEVKMILIDHSV